MLFTSHQRSAIKRGEVTLTFRRWKRSQARAGHTQRLDSEGVVRIIDVRLVQAPEISDADARRAGYADAKALIAGIERRGALEDERLHRVAFVYEALVDPRTTLAQNDALSEDDLRRLNARLDKLDRASAHGPWTRQTLTLIEANPRVLSTMLAAMCGRERLPFKADVRKLKALGLTVSHEVGYELSPRGRALLHTTAPRGERG